MNRENGQPQVVVQRARGGGSSLILFIIMLFLLLGGESEQIARNELSEAIQAMKDDYSNYTAWQDGLPTNFTLQRETHEFVNLRQAFLHEPNLPPTTIVGYYHNITGNYHSKSIRFRNITSPPPEVGWGSLANALYDGKNITAIRNRAEGWNWTQEMRLSFSIFSYKSQFLPVNASLLYRFKGFIDLEPVENNGGGMVDSPMVSLRMEGVHLPHNGSLVALVEPKNVMPDIRHLPGLVPLGYENATIQIVSKQLAEWIDESQKRLEAGDGESQSEESIYSRCSFTFHGQMDPILAPQGDVDEYEKELATPSGIPFPPFPKPRLSGVFISEECGILLELEEVTGLPSSRRKRRIITYSAIASVVFYFLIQYSLQMNDQWRTSTSLIRGSRGVMASWLVADSYAALSHLMAAVMATEVRFVILVPAFLSCVLLAADLRLLTALNAIQMMLGQTAAPAPAAPTPAPTPAPAPSTAPNPPTTPDTIQAPAPAPANPTQTSGTGGVLQPTSSNVIPIPSPTQVAIVVVRWLFENDFKAWFTVVGILWIFSAVFFGVPIYGAWFLLVSSTWSAQVLRNVYQRSRRVVSHDTVILSSIFRLFIPLYLFACPENLLDVDPAPWVWILPTWVVIQVGLLIGQDYFGPMWFIPDLWNTESTYDYHPDLAKPDEESAEPKLGECSICMEPIPTSQSDVNPERGTVTQLCWKQAAKKRRVYAIAPCGHNFHTDCLEQWMDIKSICPQCRGTLPPM